jgi:hypothetical protein
MSMSEVSDFLNQLNLKGRAAFTLILGEQAYDKIDKSIEGINVAREALDAGWRWLSGKSINEDDYYELIENANDTGLYYYGTVLKKGDEHTSNLFNVVLVAAMYTSRQIYDSLDCKYLPQTLEEVDEEFVDQLIGYAKKAKIYNEVYIDRLKAHLIDHHSMKNSSGKVGNNLEKETLLEI